MPLVKGSTRSCDKIKSFNMDYMGVFSFTIERLCVGAPELYGGPAVPGWVPSNYEMVGAQGGLPVDGFNRVTYTFRGVDESIPNEMAEEGDMEPGVEYSVDATLEETPITMHPLFGRFFKEYGGWWENNEVKWPERNTRETPRGGGRTGLSKEGEVIENMNPFYGVRSFLDPRVIARVSSATGKGGGSGVAGEAGNPPSGFGRPNVKGAGHPWLMTEEGWVRQGNGPRLYTRAWASGGLGGWNKEIYGGNK
jgi:hypothetical protein